MGSCWLFFVAVGKIVVYLHLFLKVAFVYELGVKFVLLLDKPLCVLEKFLKSKQNRYLHR